MATQLKKTIKPSGGDYTSVAACLTAIAQNLVMHDLYFDIEIDGDWSGGADTTLISTSGYTTDASHYINIYTTPTARHNGVYTTSKYRHAVSSGYSVILYCAYVYFTGLQIVPQTYAFVDYSTAGSSGNNTRINISKCIIVGATIGVRCYLSNYTDWYVWDCVFQHCSYAFYIRQPGSTVNVWNCTIHNATNYGFYRDAAGGTFNVVNCIFHSCAVDAYGSISDSYCSTSNDNTKGLTNGGTGNRFSQTFSFTDATNHDFSLTSDDAGAKDYGVSDPGSGLFSDDILGNSRSGSWDIGAFEYVSTDTSKSVSDTGSGSDSVAGVAVSLSISDSGAGADSFGGGVKATVPLSETGHGSDSITQILATLLLIDSGHGADILAQIAAAAALSDSGHGSDGIASLTAQVPLSDSGTGADAIAQILASLSVADIGYGIDTAQGLILVAISDAGSGADSVYQISVSIPVQETGQGVDQVARISATVSLADTGQGQDFPQILATVSVPDSGTGLDLITVLSEALKAIADAGHGVDAVSSIAVVVPVADVGAGVDILGTIEALLHVLDMGRGTEIVVRQMDTRLIAEIRFRGKPHPSFTGAPRISFTGRIHPKFKA